MPFFRIVPYSLEFFFIGLVAAFASLLTFFSGFGLGTLLTPAFILFFPPEVAIALTGVVHLLNNFFKISLVGKYINWNVAIKFGATSIIGSLIGATLLVFISDIPSIYTYSINGKVFSVTPVKVVVAVLLMFFALLEVVSAFEKIRIEGKKLLVGGLVSGFFGGLSGNQGALRSIFLLRSELPKESYIATGILIACVVDISRLLVYFSQFEKINVEDNLSLLFTAILSAFAGAYIGNKLLKKITMKFIQRTVAVLIMLLAVGLGAGIV